MDAATVVIGDDTVEIGDDNIATEEDTIETEEDASSVSSGKYISGIRPLSKEHFALGFELLEHDVSIYLNSLSEIENDTGLPLTYIHDMIFGPSCSGCRGYFQSEDEHPQKDYKVEVEYIGSKDLVMCSLERPSYSEVDVVKPRRGIFRLSKRRGRKA